MRKILTKKTQIEGGKPPAGELPQPLKFYFRGGLKKARPFCPQAAASAISPYPRLYRSRLRAPPARPETLRPRGREIPEAVP